MSVTKNEILFAVDIAIEGQGSLHYKWEGEYGGRYQRKDGTNPTRDFQLKQIEETIAKLKAIRASVK